MEAKQPIRHFFTNMVCGLIANKARRKKVRVLLNSDLRAYIKFIRRDLGVSHLHKIRTAIGYGAQNLIVIVNDAWVYKFPLCKSNPNEIALREKRIVDAFSKISPIYVPPVQLLQLNNMYVRKYEFIHGRTFAQLRNHEINAHIDEWSTDIAKFIYVMAKSDPEQIADLKPADADTPKEFYGWAHGDIAGNFMIDNNTHKIIAVIDWEDCRYGDFSGMWTSSLQRGTEFYNLVRDKYLKLCGGK